MWFGPRPHAAVARDDRLSQEPVSPDLLQDERYLRSFRSAPSAGAELTAPNHWRDEKGKIFC